MALQMEMNSLLIKGAIEEVESSMMSNSFCSVNFLVPKKGWQLKSNPGLIYYLKRLPFERLHTADILRLISLNEWFTTLNLKNACFHIPINQASCCFLHFTFQGCLYQFVLPFSLFLVPRVFSRCIHTYCYPDEGRHENLPLPG